MSQLKKSAQSVGLIVVISLGSKVLGFFRQALIASRYGSGVGTDTFFIALSAITLFSAILTQTINTTLIPVLSDVEIQEGKEGKRNHFNNFLNTLSLVAIALSAVAFVLAPFIMKIMAKGFEGEQFAHAVRMMRIGLPILLISTLVGSFRGYLQTEERFLESAIADYPFNFVNIFFLLVLAQKFSITAFMVSMILAEAAKLIIAIPSLRKLGYHYEWIVDVKDEYMQKIAILIPPVLLSVGIGDVNNIVDRSMASSLVDGSVSSLQYANTLKGLVQAVFVTAILTVVFPILSKEANAKNHDRLKRIIQMSMNIVLLILIPATIGMIILAEPAVKFAYQRGEFGDQAAWMTQTALVAYSIGIVGLGIKSLLTRVFYSLQDTKTPMINSVYNLVSNILLNIILVRRFGHVGLAMATSLTMTITAVLLLYELRKKIGPLGLSAMIQSSLKILASSIGMGVVVYGLYHYSVAFFAPSRIFELVLVVGTIGVAAVVYVLLLYAFKVEELQFLIDRIKTRMTSSEG